MSGLVLCLPRYDMIMLCNHTLSRFSGFTMFIDKITIVLPFISNMQPDTVQIDLQKMAQNDLTIPNNVTWKGDTQTNVSSPSPDNQLSTMTNSYRQLLEAIGEDPEREGLKKTPARAAKALQYFTKGYKEKISGFK